MRSKRLCHESLGGCIPNNTLLVGARSSTLSRVQLQEVEEEIQGIAPWVQFSPVWIETIGDRNRSTSLRSLGNTNFFTKEIDEELLCGAIRNSGNIQLL